MATGLNSVLNYMAPAVGTPRAYVVSEVLSATPLTIDFRNITGGGIDAQPFNPSGVFIDNSQGTGPLVVTIVDISYSMTCPAGQSLNAQFPAPMELTARVTGNGQATVIFVDVPVLPYRSF